MESFRQMGITIFSSDSVAECRFDKNAITDCPPIGAPIATSGGRERRKDESTPLPDGCRYGPCSGDELLVKGRKAGSAMDGVCYIKVAMWRPPCLVGRERDSSFTDSRHEAEEERQPKAL